jgi:hypothetical protein
MLIKCYEHLHPLTFASLVDSQFAPMDTNVRCGLGIIEMANSSSEPIKECVTRKLLQFKRFPIDVKDIKCLLV